MFKKETWTVTVGGKKYHINYLSSWTGTHSLKVNGEDVDLQKSNIFHALVGMEQPIDLGGKTARFVIFGSKADLVVDGFYLNSQKKYVPLGRMPAWTWAFIASCAALPFAAQGEPLPVVSGALGIIFCVRVSFSPYMDKLAKVMACTAISAVAWLVYLLPLWQYG